MDGDNQPSNASAGVGFFRDIYPNTPGASPVEAASQSEMPEQIPDVDRDFSNYHFDQAWFNYGRAAEAHQPGDDFNGDGLFDMFEENGMDQAFSNEPLPADDVSNMHGNTSMVPMENDTVSPDQLLLPQDQAQQQQHLVEQQMRTEEQLLIEQLRQWQQQQEPPQVNASQAQPQAQPQLDALPAPEELPALEELPAPEEFPALEDILALEEPLAQRQLAQQQLPTSPAQPQLHVPPAVAQFFDQQQRARVNTLHALPPQPQFTTPPIRVQSNVSPTQVLPTEQQQQQLPASPAQHQFGTPLAQQQLGIPLAQQQFGTPLAQQQLGIPLAQQQFGIPLAQQQFGTPLAQQQLGTPLAQQQFSTPLAQQQLGIPLAQQQFGTPLAQQQLGTPLAQQQFGTPLAQQQFGTPLAQQQFGTPLAQQQFGIPLAQQQLGTPPAQQQFGIPLAQQQLGTPLAQQQFGTPLAQQQLGIPPAHVQFNEQQQQRPQVNAFLARPLLSDILPPPVRFDLSPTQIRQQLQQLQQQQQQQQQLAAPLARPDESPAQPQLLVPLAQTQLIGQQQQQLANQQQYQVVFNTDAFLGTLSRICNRIRPLLDMSCRLIEHLNKMDKNKTQQEYQMLARFQVDPWLSALVEEWWGLGVRHPIDEVLRGVAQVPADVSSIRFDLLLLMALCASRDFMNTIYYLQVGGFFGTEHAQSIALRQAIVECHTLMLNTFSSVLSILRADGSLLPVTLANNALVVLHITDPPEDDRRHTERGMASILQTYAETFYSQCHLVRLAVPQLPEVRPLPPQLPVCCVSFGRFQFIRRRHMQIRKTLPPAARQKRSDPKPTTFSHANDQDIVYIENEVRNFLDYLYQRLPRQNPGPQGQPGAPTGGPA